VISFEDLFRWNHYRIIDGALYPVILTHASLLIAQQRIDYRQGVALIVAD
jgi:hypothetical protein